MTARPIDEQAAEALRKYRESRHRWLLWGNLASLGAGAALIAASLVGMANAPAPFCNEFNGYLVCSGGVEVVPLMAFALGLVVLFLAGDVMYHTDGFQHRRYDHASRIQKAFYLVAAMSGLPAAIAMAVIVAL
jgi:hypothetical protein